MTTAVAVKINDAYRRVLTSAETIKNNDHQVVRLNDPGEGVRQGDVYIVALDIEPKEASPYVGRQLAPGTTKGARHIVEGDCYLFTPDVNEATAILNRLVPATKEHRQFLGPVIRARSSIDVLHPDHGNWTIPARSYLVTYQRTWRDAIQRALD